jgi:putative ABC transport system permease protein
MVIRTEGPPLALAETVRRAVAEVAPNQPVFAVETMEDVLARRVGGYALIANLMATLALISLVLGAVGIYGVTAYAVGRRTHEIGVRMAMGAERADVMRMVLREGMARSVGGLVLGLVLAWGLSRVLASVTVGVSPRDPATFGAVTGVLLVVAFLGSYLPGRRATRVDPVEALSSE